jgi:hypothetical protein
MSKKRDALALQGTTKLRLGKKPVNTEQGHGKAA